MAKVIVYSTTTCPACMMAKTWLNSHKIKFQDINVQEDMNKAREMIEKSGQMGVPVIEVDGKIVVGFDREALKRLLKVKE